VPNTTLTLTRHAGPAELAAMGFLTQYRGNTLALYRIHLKVLFTWCAQMGIDPLAVGKTHLELFRHYLEQERHNGVGTVNARLTMVRTFYRYCAAEDLIDKSPAERLSVPRTQRDESRLVGLSRLELSTLLQVSKSASPTKWALISLMGLLGLRVSEACSVQIEDTRGESRGYRTLALVGKGGKPATMPITVPVGRAIDTCAGERIGGQLLLRADGAALDRRTAYRWVHQLAAKAGINTAIHPHSLRHAFVTLSLDAGVPLRDVQSAARHADPRMTERYDRARGALDRHAAHYLSAYVAGAA
jgi:integrase/recombinase XerD